MLQYRNKSSQVSPSEGGELLPACVNTHLPVRGPPKSGKKKEHKDKLFGSGDRPVGWGSSTRRGGGRNFVPALESLSSLGFEERNLGCPGNFAGMSRTPLGVQKVCAKKLRAHFSFPTKEKEKLPKMWKMTLKAVFLSNFSNLCSYPKDSPVLKLLRRVNFGAGSKFGTEVVKRYGEGSETLVLLGKKGRKTVQTVKNYGASKTLRIQAP